MSTLACCCNQVYYCRHTGRIYAPLYMHSLIGCARLQYVAYGSSSTRFEGKFRIGLTGQMYMEVHERFVDTLLFWHANMAKGAYKIRRKCGLGHDDSVIYVSDGEIYFDGQFIEPVVQFVVVPNAENGFRLKLHGTYCHMLNVIATSLAVNGKHLMY